MRKLATSKYSRSIPEGDDGQRLTDQEQKFVEAYFLYFDHVKAWLKATGNTHYKPYEIKTRARAMFMRSAVSRAIFDRLDENIMQKVEVLWRLTEQARGMHGQYIKPDGTVDLEQMEADGRMHLVKSIKKNRYGLVVEFMDVQDALEMLGRHYKLFTDKVEMDNKDVTIRVVYEDPYEEEQ